MVKKLLRRIGNNFGYDLIKIKQTTVPFDLDSNTIDTYNKVKAYTMTSPERIASLCAAIKYIIQNNIDGDIVECGVWKGGSSMAAIDTLIKGGDIKRSIYLYDTYEGMSAPTDKDKEFTGTSAAYLLNNSSRENQASVWCVSALEEVRSNIESLKYPTELIHYIKGRVEDTIPSNLPLRIALLRLDTDWYQSTAHELKYLYPLLEPGGVIIIDDYGHWEGARKAVDEYIIEHKLPLLLNRIDYTGRIGIKISAPSRP